MVPGVSPGRASLHPQVIEAVHDVALVLASEPTSLWDLLSPRKGAFQERGGQG